MIITPYIKNIIPYFKIAPMQAQYRIAMHNFRVSIRRRQIDRLFQSNRYNLLNSQKHQCIQELSNKLNDRSYRSTWIQQIGTQLAGQPTPEWRHIIMQILHSVRAFKDQHSMWVTLGIIKALTDLFRPQYQHLQLGRLASEVLTDVIYFCQISDPKVIKSILSYDCVDNLIQRLHQHFKTEYMRLIASICKTVPDLRSYLTERGCFQLAVDRVRNSKLKNSQQIKICLFVIENMVSVYQVDSTTYLYPKKSTVIIALQLMGQQIFMDYLPSGIAMILRICSHICAVQKQQVFNKIMSLTPLINKCLQLLTFQQDIQITRQSSIFLSKLLLSKNPLHTEILLNQGVLDRINYAYTLYPNNMIRQSLLDILSNLSADFDFAKQWLLKHPLFIQFVIDSTSTNYPVGVRREAVYIICNFLHDMEPRWNEKILTELKICQILINVLTNNPEDQKTISEIVHGFRALIDKIGQPIVDMLNFYAIQQVLGNLQMEEVQQCIWTFLQLFGEMKDERYWLQ